MMKEVRYNETEKYEISAEVKLERELDSEDLRFESWLVFLSWPLISLAANMNRGVPSHRLAKSIAWEDTGKHLACGLHYSWGVHQVRTLACSPRKPQHLTHGLAEVFVEQINPLLINKPLLFKKKKNPKPRPPPVFFLPLNRLFSPIMLNTF